MRWLFILLPVSFGLFLVYGGVAGVRYQLALQRRGVRAKGMVVDVKVIQPGRGPSRSKPVVEFVAFDGHIQRFETDNWPDSLPEKGSAVDVTYLLDDPSVAALAGTERSISGSVAAAILGLLFLAPLLLVANPQSAMNGLAASMKWVALVIIGGTGLAFFSSGAIWAAKRYVLQRSGARTEGTIVRFVQKARGSGSLPVVEFTTRDGQKREFTASTAADYQVGAHLAVIYDGSNPSMALLAEFKQFWLDPLGMALFGLFFLFFGALAFHFLRNVTLPPLPTLPDFIRRRP